MNIEKIFKAVNEDDMNSPLISIVNGIEKQGYSVKLEGVDVTADDLDDNLYSDLEKSVNEFNFEISKNGIVEQKFKLKFLEYHKFCFFQA